MLHLLHTSTPRSPRTMPRAWATLALLVWALSSSVAQGQQGQWCGNLGGGYYLICDKTGNVWKVKSESAPDTAFVRWMEEEGKRYQQQRELDAMAAKLARLQRTADSASLARELAANDRRRNQLGLPPGALLPDTNPPHPVRSDRGARLLQLGRVEQACAEESEADACVRAGDARLAEGEILRASEYYAAGCRAFLAAGCEALAFQFGRGDLPVASFHEDSARHYLRLACSLRDLDACRQTVGALRIPAGPARPTAAASPWANEADRRWQIGHAWGVCDPQAWLPVEQRSPVAEESCRRLETLLRAARAPALSESEALGALGQRCDAGAPAECLTLGTARLHGLLHGAPDVNAAMLAFAHGCLAPISPSGPSPASDTAVQQPDARGLGCWYWNRMLEGNMVRWASIDAYALYTAFQSSCAIHRQLPFLVAWRLCTHAQRIEICLDSLIDGDPQHCPWQPVDASTSDAIVKQLGVRLRPSSCASGDTPVCRADLTVLRTAQCEQGHVVPCMSLARRYEKGLEGYPRDSVKAVAYAVHACTLELSQSKEFDERSAWTPACDLFGGLEPLVRPSTELAARVDAITRVSLLRVLAAPEFTSAHCTYTDWCEHLKKVYAAPLDRSNLRDAIGFVNSAVREGRMADAYRELAGVHALVNARRAAAVAPLRAALDSVFLALCFDQRARAVERLDTALALTPIRANDSSHAQYVRAATYYALAGRPDRSLALMEGYLKATTDTALIRSDHAALTRLAAEEYVASHPLDAVTYFRRGLQEGAPCRACLTLGIARAFDAAHLPDSAITMYEQFLGTPSLGAEREEFLALDAEYAARVHKRLAELYDAKRWDSFAIRHYRAFVELWRKADPDLQPTVAQVTQRLRQLGASP